MTVSSCKFEPDLKIMYSLGDKYVYGRSKIAQTKKTHGGDDMSKYMPCKDANLQANNGVALAIPLPTFMIFLTPYKMCKNGILTEKGQPPPLLLKSSKPSSLLRRMMPTIPNITDVQGRVIVQPGASPESASKSSTRRYC